MGGHPAPQRDVHVARLRRTVRQGLQLVVGLARQVDLRVRVAGEVLAGDAHAPDPQQGPTLVAGVEPRGLAGFDPPQLFLAVPVVVAVVGHPQIAPARPVPVAEEHRERAPARRQRDGLGVRHTRCRRSDEAVVGACARRLALVVEREVVAEGERRQGRRRRLPCRTETDGPAASPIEGERLVGPLEPAVAEAAQDHVLTESEHGQIDVTVPVDVDGVRPGDRCQVRRGIRGLLEPERAADLAPVAVKRRVALPARQVEIRPLVVVAVECRDAAPDDVRVIPGIRVLDAGLHRLLDEVGRVERHRRPRRGRVRR